MTVLVDTFLHLLEVSVATSAVILPLCLASRSINKRYAAKWKYFIWLVLAVRLTIPVNLPSITHISFTPGWIQASTVETAQVNDHSDGESAVVEKEAAILTDKSVSVVNNMPQPTETEAPAAWNLTDIAAVTWVTGVCVFLVYECFIYWIFRNDMVANGKKATKNRIEAKIDTISQEIHLHREVRVVVHERCQSPMMIGVIRPVLVIPHEHYTDSHFDMIVRHELTHCKRHDIVFKMFLTAVNALHWFNPIVYLMVHEANADIELCCDADVLRNADSVQRKTYAESILSSMDHRKGLTPVSTCFCHGGIGKMKERFEHIFHSGKRHSGIVLLITAAVMSVLLGTFVSCGNDVHSQDGAIVSDSSAKVSDNIMPIVETAGLELVDIEKIPDMPYPAEGDYLTLHEALYAFNYARSRIYADIMMLPEEERGEPVYLAPYGGFAVNSCTYFGSGVPCEEWKSSHWHLPFHSETDDYEFLQSPLRPVWGIIVKPPSEVPDYTETIYVDAQTGDMYNDSKQGGYYPSPYLDRSEYARILHDEELKQNATSTTITDATQKTTAASSVNKEISDQELVTIRDYIPNILIDVKYATADNFTGQVIYDFSEPSLRYGTVKKLMKVQKELNELGYSLKIWDAYRPIEAQLKLWEVCPDPAYVSDPSKGYSGHCRGNTIDVTLVTTDGKEIEMPSGYDEFSALADRDYSDVSSAAAKNAALLESVMKKHGFKGYQAEWWHYTDTVSYRVVK